VTLYCLEAAFRFNLLAEEDQYAMFKRLSGYITFLLMSIMLLSACGGSSGNQNITITIWHDWQGSYLTAKQAIFDAYHNAHPSVTFKLVNQQDMDNKATLAVKSGNGPDVILDPVDHIGTLAKAGVIIPVDQYLSKDTLQSIYTQTASASVQFGGKAYGVPEVTEIVTLMYNKDLITQDQLPKTTDDLLTFDQNFNKQHSGMYGLVWNPTDAYQDAGFFYGFGTTYIDEQGNTQIGSPTSVQAATYLKQYASLLPKDISYDVANTLFTEKKAAMIINGPWAYSDYASKLNLGFAVLPTVTATGKPMSPFVGGKAFMVTKTAKNIDTIIDALKFFTNADNQATMCLSTGEIPSNKAASDDPKIQANTAIAAFVAQSKNGVPFPNTPYMGAVWTPMQDAMTAMLAGKQAPDQAMSAAEQSIKSGVAKINS
jgi:arabinogalactan oligomer / maltooligosaccharide transport system substrate-binding protein